jgi:large repetitive protein
VGVFYNASLGLVGGTPPYVAYVSAGALPHGLGLDSFNGRITGTPGFAGVFRFTVHVADRANNSASRTFQISVAR